MTIKRKKFAIILAISLSLNSFPVFASDYKDISTHWAKDSINQFHSKGYINGYEENNFLPNKQITRAEFIKVLNKSMNLEGKKEVDFKDVSKDSWFYEELATALYNGYISGYNDKTFRPNEPITRAEVCVIMARLNKLPSILTEDNGKEIEELNDVPKWARESVKSLVNANIISGYNDKSLAVDRNISRAEAVVVLDKFKTVEEDSKKDVIVNSLDEVPQNTVIVSNLIIAEELAKDQIKLENVKIGGKLIIKGSGDKPLTILSCDIRGDLEVNRQNANVVFSGDTKVKNVVLQKDATLSAKDLNINLDKITISKDFSGKEVNILLPAKNLEVLKSTEINIKENIQNVEISSNAKQAKLFVSDDKKIENIKSEDKQNITKESEKLETSKSKKQSSAGGGGGGGGGYSPSSSSSSSTTSPNSNEETIKPKEEDKKVEPIKEENAKDIKQPEKEQKENNKIEDKTSEIKEENLDKKIENNEKNSENPKDEKDQKTKTDNAEEKKEEVNPDNSPENENKLPVPPKSDEKEKNSDVNSTSDTILKPEENDGNKAEENKMDENTDSSKDKEKDEENTVLPKEDENKNETPNDKNINKPQEPNGNSEGVKPPTNEQPNKDVNQKTPEEIKRLEDDKKAESLIRRIRTSKNSNLTKYVNEKGETRVVFWVKGITPPDVNSFRKDIYISYVTPVIDYIFGDKWYDVDKEKNDGNPVDLNLCFAAVSSNMLHWWLEQNSEYVDKYIDQQERLGKLNEKIAGSPLYDIRTFINSFENQQKSAIFNSFKVHFGNNSTGYYSDILVDLFINGCVPKSNGGTNYKAECGKDKKGGFFYTVFGDKLLTDRAFSGNYNKFGDLVKTKLGQGEIIGLSHKTYNGRVDHIITMWGAEFDLNGNIVGVYVTDSDDQNEKNYGMKRMNIKNIDGYPKLSNNLGDPNHGPSIEYLQTLSLGQDIWEEYFRNNP